MAKHKVAIVGGGKGGSMVYRILKETNQVEIVGLADINPLAEGMEAARQDGVYVTANFLELFKIPGLDVVIEATGLTGVQEKLHQRKPSYAAVMEGKAAALMMTILDERQQLLEIRTIKGELDAILNSVQEGIEVASMNGTIKYVNTSFTKMSGIAPDNRIGKNIFDVSPHGALAQCIKSRQSIMGYRTVIGGSEFEVFSNAAPIFANEEMVGAVVVLQPLTDVMKLMEAMSKQSRKIERLSVKFEQATSGKYTFDDVIGADQSLKDIVTLAEKIAATNSTLLILGESGTGKELFAHAIHNASTRRDRPFIKVNCAAIPETLLESEFFGYEKGAFTGAVKDKMGKFELANYGTIFLDEIGDMSLHLQSKLLRVIQEREIERVGGEQTITIDVRVIAATNRNLPQLIATGKFREDLYYRLNVMELTLPPLRERKEDIPQLVNHMLLKYNRLLGKNVYGLSEDAMSALYNYNWPGNLRELENVIERAVVTADTSIITSRNLGLAQDAGKQDHGLKYTELQSIEDMERRMCRLALEKYGYSVAGKKRAAEILGISIATLYNKLKKYRIFENRT